MVVIRGARVPAAADYRCHVAAVLYRSLVYFIHIASTIALRSGSVAEIVAPIAIGTTFGKPVGNWCPIREKCLLAVLCRDGA